MKKMLVLVACAAFMSCGSFGQMKVFVDCAGKTAITAAVYKHSEVSNPELLDSVSVQAIVKAQRKDVPTGELR